MKTLLNRAGKNQTEIAYRLEVTEQTVRNWMNGSKVPRMYVTEVPRLLETLNCSLDELVEAVKETQAQRDEHKGVVGHGGC